MSEWEWDDRNGNYRCFRMPTSKARKQRIFIMLSVSWWDKQEKERKKIRRGREKEKGNKKLDMASMTEWNCHCSNICEVWLWSLADIEWPQIKSMPNGMKMIIMIILCIDSLHESQRRIKEERERKKRKRKEIKIGIFPDIHSVDIHCVHIHCVCLKVRCVWLWSTTDIRRTPQSSNCSFLGPHDHHGYHQAVTEIPIREILDFSGFLRFLQNREIQEFSMDFSGFLKFIFSDEVYASGFV